MTHPMDQPEPDGFALVMPFVVCRSAGGPYEDLPFAAGWQAGQIDQALRTAATVPAATVHFPIVHAPLLTQLELIGMRHGYPRMTCEPTGHDQQWTAVTFTTTADSSQPPGDL